MLALDHTMLAEVGLGELQSEAAEKVLRHTYDTLEMRVGMRLAGRMSDGQLDEFELLMDAGDEAAALTWLEANFPDYKQVVAEEFARLKSELSAGSGRLLASARVDATSR